jgi:hypothetical protein
MPRNKPLTPAIPDYVATFPLSKLPRTVYAVWYKPTNLPAVFHAPYGVGAMFRDRPLVEDGVTAMFETRKMSRDRFIAAVAKLRSDATHVRDITNPSLAIYPLGDLN